MSEQEHDVDASRFADTIFGRPAREPGKQWSFTYYQPREIPRTLSLDMSVVMELSTADAALGNLAGISTLISDPSLLIGPYLRREAVASSRIEGTQASLSDVLQAEISPEPQNDDIAEVNRYLAATHHAYELSKKLPITSRMLLDVHRVLMSGVRGEERIPGEFRTSPVWVGSAGATPESAVYVPPLPSEIADLLGDWERYVNEPSNATPPLVRAALLHYQFETIHPFLDGNGRIGRLLINIFLKEQGRLPEPLLYLSNYFETHRHEYYDSLQGVRERGDINRWLSFFLRAVTAQSNDAIKRSRQLIELREEYRRIAAQDRSNLAGLVELIVSNPFVTVKSAEQLGLTNQGTRNLLRRAESLGWLSSIGSIGGRGGREAWVARDILRVMEAPMDYGETEPRGRGFSPSRTVEGHQN